MPPRSTPSRREVKDRLESIRSAPRRLPTEESPAGADESGDWGAALDGAFSASTTAPESEPVEEVVTGFEAEMLAVGAGAEPDAIGVPAGEPEPVAGFEGELEPTPPDQLEAAPPAGEPEPLPPIEEIQPEDELDDDEEELLLSEGDLEPEEEPAKAAPVDTPQAGETLRPFLSAEELEAELESDARALLSGGNPRPEGPRPFLTPAELEAELESDAEALLSGGVPGLDEPRALLTEDDLDAALETDARALLSDRAPEEEELQPLLTEEELDEAIAEDARALLSEGPMSAEPGTLDEQQAAERGPSSPESGPGARSSGHSSPRTICRPTPRGCSATTISRTPASSAPACSRARPRCFRSTSWSHSPTTTRRSSTRSCSPSGRPGAGSVRPRGGVLQGPRPRGAAPRGGGAAPADVRAG